MTNQEKNVKKSMFMSHPADKKPPTSFKDTQELFIFSDPNNPKKPTGQPIDQTNK